MKIPAQRIMDERGSTTGEFMIVMIIWVFYLVIFTWYMDSGFAATTANADSQADWFTGFTNGVFVVPSWLVSIFRDDMGIYRVDNTGLWYNFWFLLGAGSFARGSTRR